MTESVELINEILKIYIDTLYLFMHIALNTWEYACYKRVVYIISSRAD